MPNLSVIIPILDEKENLTILSERLAQLSIDGQFIFVDDGSKDGSRETISDLSKKDKRFIGILNENRIGHMGSYLKGLEVATAHHIVIMDGDMQHPPESLPKIQSLLSAGYDLVVGSRYNGRIFIGNRDKKRGLISRGAEFFLKLMVKECRGLSDPVSGFIGFRKSLRIPVTSVMRGNKLLPFLIVANPKIKVGYVLYQFSERTVGKSKIVGSGNHFIRNYMMEVAEIRKVRRDIQGTLKK